MHLALVPSFVATVANTAIAIHWDHHDDGEFGVTIDGVDYSDLSAFHVADEYEGEVGRRISLAAEIAIAGTQSTLTRSQVEAAAAACGLPFIEI